MNTKTRRPARVADSYVSTVSPKAPARHKDVIPSTGGLATEKLYTPPPGLDAKQQTLVEECGSFLTNYKISVLSAKLIGGIKDLDTFTDEEVRAVKARGLRLGIDLS